MYSKNQVEELAIAQVNGKDITPRSIDASGKIEGGEIVEKMSGYSAVIPTENHNNLDVEGVYTGAVKNGNKLTLVHYVKIKRTDTITGDCAVCIFTIPSSIGEKLYPTDISGIHILDSRNVVAFENYQTLINLVGLVEKGSNTQLNYWLANVPSTLNNLELNVDYYVRFEQTFLLSDNLID